MLLSPLSMPQVLAPRTSSSPPYPQHSAQRLQQLHAAFHRRPCCALNALNPSSCTEDLTESSSAGACSNASAGPSPSCTVPVSVMVSDGTYETPLVPSSSMKSSHNCHRPHSCPGSTRDSHNDVISADERSDRPSNGADSAAQSSSNSSSSGTYRSNRRSSRGNGDMWSSSGADSAAKSSNSSSSSSSSSSNGNTPTSGNRSKRPPGQPLDWANAAQALLARSHGRQPLEPLPVLHARTHAAGSDSHSLHPQPAPQPYRLATPTPTLETAVSNSHPHESASQPSLQAGLWSSEPDPRAAASTAGLQQSLAPAVPQSHPRESASQHSLPGDADSSGLLPPLPPPFLATAASAPANACVETGTWVDDAEGPMLLPPLPPPAQPEGLEDTGNAGHAGVSPPVSTQGQGLRDPEGTHHKNVRPSVSLQYQGLWDHKNEGTRRSRSLGGSDTALALPESAMVVAHTSSSSGRSGGSSSSSSSSKNGGSSSSSSSDDGGSSRNSMDGVSSRTGSSSSGNSSNVTGSGSSSGVHDGETRAKRAQQQGSRGMDKRLSSALKWIHVGSDPDSASHPLLAEKLLSTLEARPQVSLLADTDVDILVCLQVMLHASYMLSQAMLSEGMPSQGMLSQPMQPAHGRSDLSKVANSSSTRTRPDGSSPSQASSSSSSSNAPGQSAGSRTASSSALGQSTPASTGTTTISHAHLPVWSPSAPPGAYQQQHHHQRPHQNVLGPSHAPLPRAYQHHHHHHHHQQQHLYKRPAAAHSQPQAAPLPHADQQQQHKQLPQMPAAAHLQPPTPPPPAARHTAKPSVLVFKPHLRPLPATNAHHRPPPPPAAATAPAATAAADNDHENDSVGGSQAPHSLLSDQPPVPQLHQPLSQAQQHFNQDSPSASEQKLSPVEAEAGQDSSAGEPEWSQAAHGSQQAVPQSRTHGQASAQGLSICAMQLTEKEWRLSLAVLAAPVLNHSDIRSRASKSNYLSVPAPQRSKDRSPARFGESTMRRRLAHRLLVELDKHGMAYMVASPSAARALAIRCVATVNGWLASQSKDSTMAKARKAGGRSGSTNSSSRRNHAQGTVRGSRLNRQIQEQSRGLRRLTAGGKESRQCGSAVLAAEEVQELKPDGTQLPFLLMTVILM